MHPEIGAWLDRVRDQLDPSPSPPPKKLEPEWALIAGVATGILLLLSGSIYWLWGGSSKNDEPVLVVARGTSTDAAAPVLASGASTPPRVAVEQTRVPRVTEEAPTLPVENDSGPALRTAATTEARATAAALTAKEPIRTNSTGSRIADTKRAPERAAEAKPEAPKTPRESTPASARPQPAEPAATKVALAEQVAAPVQSAAAAPMPSAPEPVIEMPRLKSMRAPTYPVSEMRAGNSGTTTLELLVLESGLVGEVTVLTSSGYPNLDAAAVAVAKRSWKFFPATQDGKPMPMKIEAPVRFSLED